MDKPSKRPQPSGDDYAGPYRLLETLGKGGLATVKVGLEFESGTRVAVKIVDKEKLANPREQVSMAREITIMKLLKHNNILRLYDIYENNEKIFLILDIYEGGDLYGHLTTNGPMRVEDALPLFKQIIEGVEYCHKNLIVHRDLKPENLLLSADKKRLVISDFGLSTGMQGSRNLLKTRCGTVHYISPEVAKGDPYVGMASDVWSVGIILYAMVTATLPFDGPSSVAVLKKIVRGEFNMPPAIPRELQDLLTRMLTIDPKERITTAQIKQHPWYIGSKEETPRGPSDEEPPKQYVLTLQDIKENTDVIGNLKLLGWDESELMNDLLSKDMNMAKVFYKLLVEHKNHLMEEKDTKPSIDKNQKVLRRRSVGGPSQASKVAATTTPGKEKRRMSEKKRPRLAERNASNRYSERPVTRHNKPENSHNDKEKHSEKEKHPEKDKHAEKHSEKDKHQEKHEKHLDASSDHSSKKDTKVVQWGISPSNAPEAKKFQLESEKGISQLLDSLQHCFKDLQLDVSAKPTKTGFKVKARRSGKRKGKTEVKVSISQKEDGQSVVSFEKSGTTQAQFQELSKKIEETFVV